ncbi:MAG: hypothetical protein COV44_03445 [Deltaproteobacteria bacterium CG11_big_fil_rev_8_21_14_0_20_45_16]|nr:MAG: hypothetical protein COV44_03445 [Deltaproteobacteria bacterium CG11_big_fil_rev_8_21_14_0_20_45_16]
MILTAHQPLYLPWLGLFHKIYLAESFCLFDIAQYQNKDFNNRNKIKSSSGDLLLSVPVESQDHFNKKICDIRIVPGAWIRKHLKSIKLSYQKAPYFDSLYEKLEKTLYKNHKFLVDLDFELLQIFLKELGLVPSIVKASDFDFVGQKSELVLDMCLKLKASAYIFGSHGKDYADQESFRAQGIDLYFQDYQHPRYNQLHGEFSSHLSVVDLLFNEGPNSLNIILENNIQRINESVLK